MYRSISKLIIYGNLPKDSILYRMGELFRDFSEETRDDEQLRTEAYHLVKDILKISTDYGFDENLWQNYLTYFIINAENPFSITSEKKGASDGSVNMFAKNDYRAFMEMFHFDFSSIDEKLGMDCFSILTDYKAIIKPELMYNANVSEKVRTLSRKLASAADEDEFFDLVTGFYKAYGVGMLGLNRAFRLRENPAGTEVKLEAVNNLDKVMLEDLVGYELQKAKLIENTEAFVSGRPANNALLYGDSGTGKSTSIKAIVNRYYDDGLRMIEIYKHQFKYLSQVISLVKNRNYRFIIYMDDLSFEDFEIEYKYLKAVIEGGLESRPENVLIYATSNRRHLIKETWKDKSDMEMVGEIHRGDSIEEKLSLANRFGMHIYFSKPSKDEFNTIVKELAERNDIHMDEEELFLEANKWEMHHGGISGRTAQQFVNHLLSLA